MPALRTAIFRDLFIRNVHTGTATLVLYISGGSIWQVTLATLEAAVVPGESVILNPGDTLGAAPLTTAPFLISGFGSLLAGAPS